MKDKNFDLKNLVQYKFGDILTLKDSNKKIICISQSETSIYYVLLDSLEIFLGISKLSRNNISNKVGELDENNKLKLANSITKSFEKNKMVENLTENQKKIILNNIKQK